MTQLSTSQATGAALNSPSTAELTIRLNGSSVVTTAQTLHELLMLEGFEQGTVATAVNGNFVPAAQRPALTLKAGDHVEIVSPRQGG